MQFLLINYFSHVLEIFNKVFTSLVTAMADRLKGPNCCNAEGLVGRFNCYSMLDTCTKSQ